MAISNLREVNVRIEDWEKRDIPRRIKALRDKTALLILGAAVQVGNRTIQSTGILPSNPVDTGFSRWQWNLSEGSPVFIDQGLPPSSAGKGSPPSFAELSKMGPALEQAGPYTILWFTNSAAYIAVLNQGHSPQAQPYWIELAASDALRLVDGLSI